MLGGEACSTGVEAGDTTEAAVVGGSVTAATSGPGGAIRGGTAAAPEGEYENDQPSIVPGGGVRLAAPRLEYVQAPAGGPYQYDQYAVIGESAMQGSSAGWASIRHTKPGERCDCVVTNPALVSASRPLVTGW
jgi:hypothetical protein